MLTITLYKSLFIKRFRYLRLNLMVQNSKRLLEDLKQLGDL